MSTDASPARARAREFADQSVDCMLRRNRNRPERQRMLGVVDWARAKADAVRLHRRFDLVRYDKIVRIGTDYGGWAVPDDRLGANSVCYCVGIGEDASFDLGLIDRYGCDVHAFDPTPVAVTYVSNAVTPPAFHFHPVGLWSYDGQIPFYPPQNRAHASYSALNLQQTEESIYCDVKRLSSLMSQLGHTRLDLLKMDIEGAEFDVIDTILADGLDIDTICVEFHRSTGDIERIVETVDRLRSGGWAIIAIEEWNVTLARLGAPYSSRAKPEPRRHDRTPEPDPGSIRVSSNYAGDQGKEYFAWQNEVGEVGAELNLWKFVDYVGPNERVIDFGCGNGALLERLHAAHKVGVEVNPAARKAALARGLHVVRSIDELPAYSADVVISNHTLEHTLDPLSELRALRQVLKPGGSIVLWLPLDDWRSQRWHKSDRNHHLFAWTPLSIGNLLQEAGFEGIQTRVVTRAWLMFYRRFARSLPRSIYTAMTTLTAIIMRRRQIFAVAHRASVPGPPPDATSWRGRGDGSLPRPAVDEELAAD
jgi:FkbM family methyltransferase